MKVGAVEEKKMSEEGVGVRIGLSAVSRWPVLLRIQVEKSN